jgi:hypothetical protein
MPSITSRTARSSDLNDADSAGEEDRSVSWRPIEVRGVVFTWAVDGFELATAGGGASPRGSGRVRPSAGEILVTTNEPLRVGGDGARISLVFPARSRAISS